MENGQYLMKSWSYEAGGLLFMDHRVYIKYHLLRIYGKNGLCELLYVKSQSFATNL